MAEKRRGAKPIGKGTMIGVRLQPESLARLDRWRLEQADKPSRPEAIRRLVSEAFKR